MGLHVFRYDYDCISVCGDEPAEKFMKCADFQVAPGAVADSPKQVAAAKGDDQGKSFWQRQQTALSELGVDQIIMLASQLDLQSQPVLQIVEWILRSSEGEYRNIDSRGGEEFSLSLDEV